MSKSIAALLMCLLSLLSGCGGGDPAPMLATTQHDNEVILTSQGQIAYLGFSYDGGWSITPGQPWSDPVTVTNGSTGGAPNVTIVAHAGRHASSTPADWLNARTTPSSSVQPDAGVKQTSINFAFSGRLDVRAGGYSYSYPIVLGQFSNGTENQWIIGGQGDGWTLYQHCMRTPDNRFFIGWNQQKSNYDFKVWNALYVVGTYPSGCVVVPTPDDD